MRLVHTVVPCIPSKMIAAIIYLLSIGERRLFDHSVILTATLSFAETAYLAANAAPTAASRPAQVDRWQH